jgi:uncharacterized protein
MRTNATKRRRGLIAALACALAGWASMRPAAAQVAYLPGAGASDGIAVQGTGELSARPNMVEIDLHVSGKAELTGDALVKYRDAKKRVLESLEKLNLKGLSTDELALTISSGNSLEQQQRMMNGVQQPIGKTQIDVSSLLRVRLKDVREEPAEELIKTVGKLLDVAQDSGVTIGPTAAEIQMNMRFGNYANNTAPVRFVVTDLDRIREKAYEMAVADARGRAARLAKLNQVKLGAALSVQEILVAGDQRGNQNVNPNIPNLRPVAEDDGNTPRVSSTSLSSIPVQVKLLVRFAIQAPDPATAQQ